MGVQHPHAASLLDFVWVSNLFGFDLPILGGWDIPFHSFTAKLMYTDPH